MNIDYSKMVTAEMKLEQAKSAKRQEITAATLAAIDAGFEYDGNVYDSDARSQTNIIGCANAYSAGIPLPADFTWRTKDNINLPINGAGVVALGASLLQHVNTQYAISWSLKEDIKAATTAQELEAVSWPGPDEDQQAT